MVYASPEAIVEPAMRRCLYDMQALDQLAVVFVDEAHVFGVWSGFRQSFLWMGALRTLLSETKFFAMSATIRPSVRTQHACACVF